MPKGELLEEKLIFGQADVSMFGMFDSPEGERQRKLMSGCLTTKSIG